MYANRKDPLDGEIFFYYSYVKTITASYVCLSSSSPEMLVQLWLMIRKNDHLSAINGLDKIMLPLKSNRFYNEK